MPELATAPYPPVGNLPAEQRLALLLDAITDTAIYLLDAQGLVCSWNAGAQRLNGYSADEVIGNHFSVFYPPEERRAGVPQQLLARAAAGRVESEGWWLRRDGTRFWAQVVLDPIHRDGELIGYAKMARDLTERRAAEAALRRSQEQFRLLVQGVVDYAIYMIDLEGRVVSWNAGAQRIKGYLPSEIIGRHFETFYRPEDRQRGDPQRSLARALAQGRFESEGWRVRKDGSSFWANVVLDAVRDDEGAIIGFAKITRDVTEKRSAQRELEAARESLFQSQKLEAIGQLTGGVAHDFNNVLMVIMSSLQLIERKLGGAPEPLVVKAVQNALKATRRGASLTQRMLAFARRQDLNPEAVDLGQLVQGMLDLLGRSLGPMIAIELDLPPGLPPALVDPNQLELALLNLAVNARDAMPDGGRIVIRVQSQTLDASAERLAPGRYLRLMFIDSGSGMDEATLARATEPFFTTKGVGKGTGLGLSMVEGLASQSGGNFVLRSRPGEGTQAELWLPAAELNGAAPGVEELAPGPDKVRFRSLQVLLVDDDLLVLDSTAALLIDLGHRVTAVGSALEALQLLNKGRTFDLLVTDQVMPAMTGSELVQLVQAFRPGLPAIIASGFAELEPSTALPSGVVRIAKPFSQRDLAEAIEAGAGIRPD